MTCYSVVKNANSMQEISSYLPGVIHPIIKSTKQAMGTLLEVKNTLCSESITITITTSDSRTITDAKKHLWFELFPGEEMIQPYEGAVDEFAGGLCEDLPDDFDIDEYIDA